jgi:hypothetical protein
VKKSKGDRNEERRGSKNGYGGDRNGYGSYCYGYGGERKRMDRKRRYHVKFTENQLQRERENIVKRESHFLLIV